jgi:peptidoglycan/LPS O-acetylase OafA/YrhL
MTFTDRPLSQAFDPKNNSLGFLRLFLALLVIFSHSYTLGGFGHEGIWGGGQETYGGIAVAGFFIISGFLITRSYRRTQSLLRFLWNRALRIFPGFWACSLMTIAVFAPILHFAKHHTLINYFQSHPAGPLQYFKANFFLEMRQYDINELTLGIPFPGAFNGSLWTLVYEMKCYIAVALLGWVGIFNKQKIMVLILFFFFFQIYIAESIFPGTAAKISPYFSDIYNFKLPLYFLAGAVLDLYAEYIVISKKVFIFFMTVLLLSLTYNSYYLIAPFALSYVILCLAIYLPFSKLDQYGDFSYGFYIYAFPIQQILSFFKLNQYGFSIYFILSVVLTFLLSTLSWFFIEKPSLSLKNLGTTQSIVLKEL